MAAATHASHARCSSSFLPTCRVHKGRQGPRAASAPPPRTPRCSVRPARPAGDRAPVAPARAAPPRQGHAASRTLLPGLARRPAKMGRGQGVQVGRTGTAPASMCLSRLSPLSRSNGASLPGSPRTRAGPAPGRHRCLLGQSRERPGLGHGQQLSGSIEGARLDLETGSGQRPPGPSPRVEGKRRGGASRNAAAAPRATARLRPGGRAFQLRGDILVRPGRGLRPVPGPAVGIERPGRSRPRARGAPPAFPRPTPTGRPPSGPADDGTAPGCRTRPGRPRPPAWPPRHRSRAARQLATPALGRQSDRPPPAASAACSRPGERQAAAGSSPRSARAAAPPRAARTRPPAQQAQPRGSSSRARGLPRVSATIWSRTRASISPGSTESSSARASASCSSPHQLRENSQITTQNPGREHHAQ